MGKKPFNTLVENSIGKKSEEKERIIKKIKRKRKKIPLIEK